MTENEGARHFGQMNSIGWIVGHLAWQEQRTLILRRKGELPFPDLNEQVGFGAPMTTPSLTAMRNIWNSVVKDSDEFLESATTKDLMRELPLDGRPSGQNLGSALRRMTFHYWFHIGEIQAIRQLLGNKGLPAYVGNLEATAAYRPEG